MRVVALVLPFLCATAQGFAPSSLFQQIDVSVAVKCQVNENNAGFRQRFLFRGKAWKRKLALVAFTSLGFRHIRPAEALVALSIPPMAFQSEVAEEKVATTSLPVAAAVVMAGGAGTALARYIVQRRETEEEVQESALKDKVEDSPLTQSFESTPVVTASGDQKAASEKKLIENLLAKVKEAETKVLVAAANQMTPGEITIGSTAASSSNPKVRKHPVETGYTEEEKKKIVNNVFDCHGFFPDLRDEDELPLEIRLMRQQPKSKSVLSSIKSKYAAIVDESERVYTMLVDLGMMESYDHLDEYSDDFDDSASE